MSATGRGRRLGGEHDHYETPKWTVDRLLEAWRPSCSRTGSGLIVEPGAGRGMVLRAAAAVLPRHEWIAVEVRPEERENLYETGAKEVYIGDFLDEVFLTPRNDVVAVLGNPPYALAMEFILRARVLYPLADIVFLLRLGFLAAEERADFMRAHVPDVYVLPNRPSFYAGNGDSADYGWMVWPPGGRTWGRHVVLASTPEEERSRKWLLQKRILVPAQGSLFLPANT